MSNQQVARRAVLFSLSAINFPNLVDGEVYGELVL